MSDQNTPEPPADLFDDGKSSEPIQAQLVVAEPGALAAISRSEIETQIAVAKKYPRSLKLFADGVRESALRTQEASEACIYTLKRKEFDKQQNKWIEKPLRGPSVRLAELVAVNYQNLHVAARPIDVGETYVTAQGVTWDLQRNVRIAVEVTRNIVGSSGKRYGADMIGVTMGAATSIAYRNSVFRVVPRMFIDHLYNEILTAAVGKVIVRRAQVIERLIKLGTTEEAILRAIGKPTVEHLTAEDVANLIGFGTAIKEGTPIDEIFPPPMPSPTPEGTPQGTKMPLGGARKEGPAAAASTGAPAPQEVTDPKGAAAAGEPRPSHNRDAQTTQAGAAAATPTESKPLGVIGDGALAKMADLQIPAEKCEGFVLQLTGKKSLAETDGADLELLMQRLGMMERDPEITFAQAFAQAFAPPERPVGQQAEPAQRGLPLGGKAKK